ncbi:MAG: hypothetical protein IRZ15_09825 [Bryobacteraceae bacterium]|nr:hypothetical protein [Bryobacteraceae bacterium]
MVQLLLLILFAASHSAVAGVLDEAPCWIRDAASNEGKVWLLCDQERVYLSDDEGATWRHVQLPSDAKLRAIHVLDGKKGFIVGNGGTLLRTDDGGTSWRSVSVPTTEDLRSVHFVGDLGWIAGYGGVVLHSEDGGATWRSQLTNTSLSLESIFFKDAKHGWSVGWNGTILRTTDGGANWEQIFSPAAKWSLRSVYFRDLQNGWALGLLGQLLRTKDGGATWVEQTAPVRSSFTSLLVDKTGRMWVTAENDLLFSEDGGESWKPVGLTGYHFLERLIAVKESIWAVGPFGILKRGGNETAWRKLETLRSDDKPEKNEVALDTAAN